MVNVAGESTKTVFISFTTYTKFINATIQNTKIGYKNKKIWIKKNNFQSISRDNSNKNKCVKSTFLATSVWKFEQW